MQTESEKPKESRDIWRNKEMDKAQAYAVLRIEPGCTQEEIKEAYAALSRQYHPEEYPEEFQQIHDAYRMLRRREQRHHTIHRYLLQEQKKQIHNQRILMH